MSLNLDKSQWNRVSLGDVATASKAKCDPSSGEVERYVAGEHMDTDNLRIERWGDVGDGYLGPAFHRRFQPGQILYGSRRTYLRKVAVADFDGVCANTTFVVDANSDRVLPEFLPFVMISERFHAHAIAESKGSVNPYVNWSDLTWFEFDLPPLDTQKRIADLFWAVETHRLRCRRRAQASQAVFEQARVALLLPSVDGELNPTRRLSGVDTWTDDLPEGWRAARIRDVARVRSGATPLREKREEYFVGGEVPWVKTLDLNEGVLTATDERITARAVTETSAKVVPAGSVLVAMYGGFGQIGRTARLGMEAATNQAVSALLDLDDGVDAEFMHEVLMAGRPRWKRVAASTRKDPNITKRDVEQFEFPLPSRQTQQQILVILRSLREAHSAALAEEEALRDLAGSLITEVFGGAA